MTGAATTAASRSISSWLLRPPPQTIQRRGKAGSTSTTRATARTVNSVSVAAPSATERPIRCRHGKGVAVERFRRRLVEIGVRQQVSQHLLIDHAGSCQRASRVITGTGVTQHPVVDQCVAGAGVAGSEAAVGLDQRDIGDAADVEEGERPFDDARSERPVVDRHQRRTFAAGGEISGAQVMDDGNAGSACERRAITELQRHPRFAGGRPRPVQHRLAMEADDVDRPGELAVRRAPRRRPPRAAR